MNTSAIFTSTQIPIPQVNPPLTLPQQIQIGEAFSSVSKEIMEKTFGTADYFSYMAVGILSFVVLFTTMFSEMSMVWDRRLGFPNKVLSTPVARGSILMSKVFSAVIRSLIQAAIVLGFAFLLGLKAGPDFAPPNLLGVFLALLLMSLGLSSIFLMIALRSTRWET